MKIFLQAQRDRQQGLMPMHIQQREDGDELWMAFRRFVGISWSNKDVVAFLAGWDAARAAAFNPKNL